MQDHTENIPAVPIAYANLATVSPEPALPRPDVPTDRPAIAVEHSGVGHIGRKTAWTLAVCFLLALFAPGIYQICFDELVLGRSQFDDLLEHPPTAASLHQFEADLTEQSRFDRWVRHTYWDLQVGGPKPPNLVVIGQHGFLYAQEETDVYHRAPLSAPAPSQGTIVKSAIVRFNSDLQKRGIRLVVVMVPLKSAIYPENLAIDYRPSDGPAFPPGYVPWLADVRQAGIDVLDLTPNFWQAKSKLAEPLFWPNDTHWSDIGRSLAADVVADHIRPLTVSLPKISFVEVPAEIDEEGDLAHRLALGWGNTRYPANHHQVVKVMRDGKPLIPGNDAPILLMGDSFSAFYTEDGYGFGDELMRRLHVAVQVIAQRGDPANTPRQMLAKDPSILADKKLVIWEIAGHFLWNPWETIPIN